MFDRIRWLGGRGHKDKLRRILRSSIFDRPICTHIILPQSEDKSHVTLDTFEFHNRTKLQTVGE